MRVSIYDQVSHIRALSLDLQRAKLIVIILSPYLQMDNIIRWLSDLEDLIARGITVCVRVDLPDEYYQTSKKTWVETRNQKLRDCVALLEKIGVHVSVVANVHTKLVIIDYHILWEGSLNFLSSNPDKKPIDERVPRVDDLIHAMNAYSRHNCERCDKCSANQDANLLDLIELTERSLKPSQPPSQPLQQQVAKKTTGNPLAPTRFARVLSRLMSQQRSIMNVKKFELAEAINISARSLESIEDGKSIPTLQTITRILELHGWRLVIVPAPIVPLLARIVKAYHRAEISKMLPAPKLPPSTSPKSRTPKPRKTLSPSNQSPSDITSSDMTSSDMTSFDPAQFDSAQSAPAQSDSGPPTPPPPGNFSSTLPDDSPTKPTTPSPSDTSEAADV